VAAYPFTTLHPNVGVIHFGDGHTITVADIPGLIEGAHEDRGLGHQFLRHIERTRVLAYVVDVAAGSDPVADLRTLQAELRAYDPSMPLRPSLVVANKMDLPAAAAGAARLRAATSLPVICVSAMHATGVGVVIDSLRFLLDAADREQVEVARAAHDRGPAA
jgi:GTP-binding protein